MTRSSFEHVDCGVARAAEVVGDKWTLAILRNAFQGMRHFDDFAQHLGVVPGVLSARLRHLVRHGVLRRQRDPADGRAVQYRLTEKGKSLYPLVIFLNQWGERWYPKPEGERISLRARHSGKPLAPVAVADADGTPLGPQDVELRAGPGQGDVYQRMQVLLGRRDQATDQQGRG